MPEAIHNLVADTRKNRFTSIPKLSEEEIISVWDFVSEYVEFQMCSQRGVHIPSLGTFTFSQKKLDIGNNKFLLIQRPVFLLLEKFAQTHALQYTKHHTTGEIPVVHLNFSAIAAESMFDRDTVEACVREVLQALSRAISNQQKIEFLFRGIGVFAVKAGKAKMKFFKDFLHAMDGSGNLLKLMENELFSVSSVTSDDLGRRSARKRKRRRIERPGTADSVMSTKTTLSAQRRPGTNTVTLPKLTGSLKITRSDLLPAITEHAADEEDRGSAKSTSTLTMLETNGNTCRPPSRHSNREHDQQEEGIGADFNADGLQDKTPGEKNALGSREEKSSNTPPMFPPTPPKSMTSPKRKPMRRSSDPEHYIAPEQPENSSSGSSQSDTPSRRSPESPSRVKKSSRPLRNDLGNCLSPKHHHKSGQDLCYLCMQRTMRNIPVSFEDERKRTEHEQDALLQQYQQLKDHEAMLIDKKSYVFQHRPLTPMRFYKQDEYSKALETQVKLRTKREEREKKDREFQERLEQIQLAEDLAAQREQFLRTKADQTSQYQKALSAQLRHKPLPLPKAEPDSEEPIFGRHDVTNEKLLEQRERSKMLLKSQLNAVSEKKKKVIVQQLTKQKEESDMLQRTKEELLADRMGAHKRARAMRCDLERNWRNHHQNKVDTEIAEAARTRTPGMLLLEQTDKYKRCGQCQRKNINCGESNIWSESRYIPGSRLIV